MVAPRVREKIDCSYGFGRGGETGKDVFRGTSGGPSKEKGEEEEVLLTPHDVAACEA